MLPDLMHATQVARPFHTKGWVYEEKIDGWRMLALKEAGGVPGETTSTVGRYGVNRLGASRGARIRAMGMSCTLAAAPSGSTSPPRPTA